MKTITLPTSPEVRAAFAELGLALDSEVPIFGEWEGKREFWSHDGQPAITFKDGEEPLFLRQCTHMLSAKVLQILGLLEPPKGMAMVPKDCVAVMVPKRIATEANMLLPLLADATLARHAAGLQYVTPEPQIVITALALAVRRALHPETPQETPTPKE